MSSGKWSREVGPETHASTTLKLYEFWSWVPKHNKSWVSILICLVIVCPETHSFPTSQSGSQFEIDLLRFQIIRLVLLLDSKRAANSWNCSFDDTRSVYFWSCGNHKPIKWWVPRTASIICTSLSVCSVRLSVCLSVCLPACLSAYLCVCLSVYLSISACLLVCLPPVYKSFSM